ncbi:MlaD family protein [Patulibacter brassicae]|uniref:MlaD family protein n=1 Tax=Patulibacter brassicae TaxID=1705717 RepID=A0ABU4VR69_9ACTN|nr:MlaD family protein [Patulibacter brassicae]MDX8153290.1 MlaD family protein [Patulibacter brassicae]
MSRRSITLLAAALVALLLVGAILVRGDRRDDDAYRFAAIFDTAQGIVPGQLVKVAGARVGQVEHVRLTPDHRARFELRIDRRFGPFHSDARCRILPEGFISESFIQCEPGTPGRPALSTARGSGTTLPTVPVGRTTASVQLQQVLDTFSLPVTERARVLISDLGLGLSGRGGDVNAVLRRANPALDGARALLTTLARQRSSIESAISDTDRVLASLAARRGAVRGFVRETRQVAATTAGRHRDLERSVAAAPALLREAETSLAALRDASRDLLPTADALRRSAPGVTRLNALMGPLSDAARPALAKIDPAFRATRAAVPGTQRLVTNLAQATRQLGAPARDARELLESSRDRGALESVPNLLYSMATVSATADSSGHVATIAVTAAVRCMLDATARGCEHRYGAPGRGRIPINDPAAEARGRRATSRAAQQPGGLLGALPQTTQRDLRRALDRLLR